MIPKPMILSALFGVLFISPFSVLAATNPVTARAISRSKYTRAHSLGDHYSFDPRDGWQTVNATDLQYKYRPHAQFANDSLKRELQERDEEDKKASKSKLSLGGALGGVIADVWKGLKGIGKPQTATITW
jgi:hypothetical protein